MQEEQRDGATERRRGGGAEGRSRLKDQTPAIAIAGLRATLGNRVPLECLALRPLADARGSFGSRVPRTHWFAEIRGAIPRRDPPDPARNGRQSVLTVRPSCEHDNDVGSAPRHPMSNSASSPAVTNEHVPAPDVELSPVTAARPSSLRSRVVVLFSSIALGALTGTCAVVSLLGFIREPNIPELFPVVLCGGVSALCLFASVGLARDMLRRSRP
jgi:hypothetical protein